MEKRIHVDLREEDLSLEDMQNKIKELSEKYPDRDVFFDGDDYAICSRKKGA